MSPLEVDGQRARRHKGPGTRLRATHQQPVVLLQSPRLGFVRKLRGSFRVREVEGWEALGRMLPSAHPTSVVVLDPYDSAEAPSAAFWKILERFRLRGGDSCI